MSLVAASSRQAGSVAGRLLSRYLECGRMARSRHVGEQGGDGQVWVTVEASAASNAQVRQTRQRRQQISRQSSQQVSAQAPVQQFNARRGAVYPRVSTARGPPHARKSALGIVPLCKAGVRAEKAAVQRCAVAVGRASTETHGVPGPYQHAYGCQSVHSTTSSRWGWPPEARGGGREGAAMCAMPAAQRGAGCRGRGNGTC